MRILLDTHVAIWAITDNPKLSQAARDLISDKNNEIFYSTASVWETIIKHQLRPDQVVLDGDELAMYCNETGFHVLPVMNHHAFALRTLHLSDGAPRHKDPFDRILLAQAKAENLKFMTHDKKIPFYNEACVISV